MEDAETWKESLDEYRYPVDLRKFHGGSEHPGWFEPNISPGDPRQTRDFEARFRKLAPYHSEAWAEVVFWKLDSVGRGIAERNASKLLRSGASPRSLWRSCNDYIEKPSRESFRKFRSLLFDTPSVATAATFPAFVCPERFPMVDTQVTKWAGNNGHLHTYAEIGGPGLEEVPVLKTTVLLESHWAFIKSWISWCQFTACILRQRTRYAWRARDVEMAVFTAQRCAMPLHPLA
ncbi:MAG: hypothetical protein OXK79_10460 [Chloroflexota bacterium]|nr:hypothetical protein [Chloroflexota bacterium]